VKQNRRSGGRSDEGGRAMPRLTIVTDAWHPQVNGVVRSIETTNRELKTLGVDVSMITPEPFRSIPMPTYPEIRLSLASPGRIGRMIEGSSSPTTCISRPKARSA
jgi:hypothetical protein